LFFSGYGLAGNATVLMVLAIGGHMVSSGSISIGDLSSFLLYTIYAGSSISGLSSFYSELMKGVGAASRIFELLDRKPIIKTTGISISYEVDL
jgi:putative ABC transport system ATP-binding protein